MRLSTTSLDFLFQSFTNNDLFLDLITRTRLDTSDGAVSPILQTISSKVSNFTKTMFPTFTNHATGTDESLARSTSIITVSWVFLTTGDIFYLQYCMCRRHIKHIVNPEASTTHLFTALGTVDCMREIPAYITESAWIWRWWIILFLLLEYFFQLNQSEVICEPLNILLIHGCFLPTCRTT